MTLHQHTCRSRINSSHAPGTLTQHSQPQAGIGTLPSPVNLKSLHLPPVQAVTKPVIGREGPFITSCLFPCQLQKGSRQKDTSAALLSPAQLCSSPSSFEGCSNSLWHRCFCCLCWGSLRDCARHCLYRKGIFYNILFPLILPKKQVLLYFQKFVYFGTRASTQWGNCWSYLSGACSILHLSAVPGQRTELLIGQLDKLFKVCCNRGYFFWPLCFCTGVQ